jgi:hypothetical protein
MLVVKTEPIYLASNTNHSQIQSIVIAGGKFEAGAFNNNSEVVSLLLNDSEMEQTSEWDNQGRRIHSN